MKFREGDIVLNPMGQLVVVIAAFELIGGNFYNVLLDGRLESFAEEELTRKN